MWKVLELVLHSVLVLFLLPVQFTFVAGWLAWRRGGHLLTWSGCCPPPGRLPFITTMLAAYQEADSLALSCARFQRVRYPGDRFELLLLTEQDDAATSTVARGLAGPGTIIRHAIVPAGFLGETHPHNKPRALAYGLTCLRPETQVVGVLDAEDLVAEDLLLKVAESISRYPIVQGRLAIQNARENLLTHWFGAEYAFLEMLQLGRRRLGWMSMPRGTTYFVRREVVETIGWSTRNLTEDLAFNMRAYAQGYETGLINTTTWEECPDRLGVWLKQRTRWFQGALQTLRERIDLSRLTLFQRLSVMQLLGQVILVPWIVAVLLPFLGYDLVTATKAGPSIPTCEPWLSSLLWKVNTAALGILGLEFAIATKLAYRHHPDLGKRLWACLLLPGLFVGLLPVAALRALWRELTGRLGWEKTPHRGDTRYPENVSVATEPAFTVRWRPPRDSRETGSN